MAHIYLQLIDENVHEQSKISLNRNGTKLISKIVSAFN